MQMQKLIVFTMLLLFSVSFVSAQEAKQTIEGKSEKAKEEAKETPVKLAEDSLFMVAPGTWEVVEPRNRIIEAEFKVKAVEGDEQSGRLTIMASGGGVKANIDRWKSQFKGGDEKKQKVSEQEIDGMKAHMVDLSGSFADSPRGPFGPKVTRENYRMLGAIVETKDHGDYFFKLYGPAKTMEANAKAFKNFVESLKLKK